MSQKELHIILAHALSCPTCRTRLLADPSAVFRGHALSDGEKETLSKLSEKDFFTVEILARGAGTSVSELRAFVDHAVVRLRHL